MVQSQFDNVIQGGLASMFNTEGLSARQVSSATTLKENGVKPQPVPGYLSAEMRDYAQMLYKKGVKPETIKRKICDRFNVTIIPA